MTYSASKTSKKRVGCNRRVGVHHVHVDQVVQPLHENHQNPSANGNASQDLRDPEDVRARCPGEPEQTDRE